MNYLSSQLAFEKKKKHASILFLSSSKQNKRSIRNVESKVSYLWYIDIEKSKKCLTMALINIKNYET